MTPRPMPADARRAFVEGFVPQFTYQGLCALRDELTLPTGRLCHGFSVIPEPLRVGADDSTPIDAACAVTFAGWQGGEGWGDVEAAESWFEDACTRADVLLGVDCGSSVFLRWFDSPVSPSSGWTEEEVRESLLAVVNEAITARAAEAVLV